MCDALAMSRVKRGQKSALPTPGCLNRQGVLRRWPQRYSIATYSDVTILSQPKTTTKLQTGLWMIDTRGWLSAEATHILSDTLLASPHYCSSTTPELLKWSPKEREIRLGETTMMCGRLPVDSPARSDKGSAVWVRKERSPRKIGLHYPSSDN